MLWGVYGDFGILSYYNLVFKDQPEDDHASGAETCRWNYNII